MVNRNKHNDGKEGRNAKGKKGNIPLRHFNNRRDDYWDKLADEWLKEKERKLNGKPNG